MLSSAINILLAYIVCHGHREAYSLHRWNQNGQAAGCTLYGEHKCKYILRLAKLMQSTAVGAFDTMCSATCGQTNEL